MQILREYIRAAVAQEVRGYIKPLASFYTLSEWEDVVNRMLDLQKSGIDTRGGKLVQHDELVNIIDKYFGYQLNVDTERYELLTRKNVLDFIEDFVNHRFWGLEKEYGHYFPDITRLRFAYFYSRGDLEPYVLLDDEYTMQLYGGTYNPKKVLHYTTMDGLKRLEHAIETGNLFDISTYTVAKRNFFRPESNVIVRLVGNIRAGFRSDIKSYAIDNGSRACNLYRLEYPGKDLNNICYELDSCNGEVRTSLWNEYITTPIKILDYKIIER